MTSPLPSSQPITFGASSKAAKEGFIAQLSKTQLRLLQDALYNAAENGFLDVVKELRVTGKLVTVLYEIEVEMFKNVIFTEYIFTVCHFTF